MKSKMIGNYWIQGNDKQATISHKGQTVKTITEPNAYNKAIQLVNPKPILPLFAMPLMKAIS